MVKLNIIVEGEAPGGKTDAATSNNAESLRESLHKFFAGVLSDDEVEVAIYMGRGCRNAARHFVNNPDCSCLYVDSDFPYEEREKWHGLLLNPGNPDKDIVIPENLIPSVFFMVQEMEAWFLKQPECLDRWAKTKGYTRKRRHEDDAISGHSLIKDKDIESIVKPSEKTALLVKTFFEDGKKKVGYGKLKSAPGIIDELDIDALLDKDRELRRFAEKYRDAGNDEETVDEVC